MASFLPLGLWWLRVWDILVGSRGPSKWNGQDMVSPARPRLGSHLLALALALGWQSPGPQPPVGLASLWDLYKTKQLHGSSSACCHIRDRTVWGSPKRKNHLNVCSSPLRNTKAKSVHNKQHCILKASLVLPMYASLIITHLPVSVLLSLEPLPGLPHTLP